MKRHNGRIIAVLTLYNMDLSKLSDVETTLADGTYKDKVSGKEFKVKDGKLSGTVKKEAVVVLYNE